MSLAAIERRRASARAEAAGIAVPPASQGAGLVAGGLVEALDLAIGRRAAGVLPGERRAAGLGTGTELAQLRPYQVGDDVRRLDAAASARTGVPHVRDHVPERTLTTWILLDVSASMAFGTAQRLKSDVAGGVATVVGRLAARRGGRVALLTCGAPVQRMLPPRGGRRGLVALQRVVDEGVAADGHTPGDGALGAGMRRIGRLARGPGLVVVISDFRAGGVGGVVISEPPPWSRELRALAARHDVLAVEVLDPRESELPDAGPLVLADPETGMRVRADSSGKELRRRFAAAELARRDALRAELRRARARHVEVCTDGDWLRALGRGLR
jgi:uncharacterized protein (DUF58 family)